MHFISFKDGLREPPAAFSQNALTNRASARRLADLNPRLIAFGHGPPTRDADAFQRFVARLKTAS
jgi:glyoxylase-like metal-dependent hydrolase (beta-lactamase superfamily II)